MIRSKRLRISRLPHAVNFLFAASAWLCVALVNASTAVAAVTSTGNVLPLPPGGGGSFAGPFEIGDVDVGTVSITGGTAISHTGPAVLGDTVTGVGIANLNGFGSDWTLTSSGADMTIGNNGTGSLNLSNLAFVSVFDDLFVASQFDSLGEISISGLGSILDVGDAANIGQRGQAAIDISNGGRLVTNQNIIGDEPAGDGRVTVSDQFSLWRANSTITVADAGRALMQILDGGRVESTAPSGNLSATIATLAGSTGTVEVIGLGSIWQNALGLVIGDFGNGTLIVGDGGRVSSGTGANLFIIGRQVGSVGRVEVSGPDSLLSAAMIEVGDSGDGTLHILDGGRVVTGTAFIGDNANSRGDVLVDGDGSSWEITGNLNIADPSDSSVTISNGGRVAATNEVRVTTFGRLTLDGGRLKFNPATPLLNTGVVQGNGVIDGSVTNNAGGLIGPSGAEPLVIMRGLTNNSLVDIQSGELEVLGATNNNSDIDARDGAILRFRSILDNNSGSQLAITSGIVDVFGPVTNDAGAEIAVGGTAVAVFHDAVTNSGLIFVQPGGEIFMLENLGFTPTGAFNVALQAIDETDPEAEPSDGFGQVQVSGAATLAGTLEVSLLNGFMPMAGDVFQILTASAGRTGMFTTELLPSLPGGLDWNVIYNPNSVVLAVLGPELLGDYNQNGVVDAADFVVWRKNLGSGTALANDDTPGVGPDDYNRWRANFGRSAGSGSGAAGFASAVPEPTNALLALTSILVANFLRRPR